MLPDIHLDQMSFDEMVDRAKNRIVSFYPDWTDFNYHDPGITLVELFAWYKEIQQYELDHIGEHHKRKYLQLLGTDIRHRSAARTYAMASLSSPCLIPEGCRLEAAGVPFETVESQMLPGVSIQCCFGWWEDGYVSFLDGDQLSLGHPLEFYPFGSKARQGTCLYIGISDALPVGEKIALTIRANRQGSVLRNLAREDTIPLARLSFSYWDGKQYQPIELIREETFGLLFDGQIVFQINSQMQTQQIGDEKGYFLCVRLDETQYETAPVISFFDMNTMRVCQKETVAKWLRVSEDCQGDLLWCEHNLCATGEVRVFSEQNGFYREEHVIEVGLESSSKRTWIRLESRGDVQTKPEAYWILAYGKDDWYRRHFVLGKGHGFPNESFDLDDEQVSYEDVELLIEEAEQPGVYVRWEKRGDFANSGPEDRHFCVDCLTGRILFGNGIHGMAPEGQVLLVSFARILGNGGNIKAERIRKFLDKDLEEIKVTNPWDAGGGRGEETVQEAFVRVRKTLMQSRNLVTARDYEQMVRATPGLRIESCKALFGANKDGKGMEQVVQLVVKPYSQESRPRLTPAFTQNILQYLEKKRLLGIRLKVVSPAYVRLSVYVEAQTYPQYQGTEGIVEQAVREYLEALKTQFGGVLFYSGLYGYIDRLDCVAGIRSLVLEAKGNDVRRTTYGDLIFPGNGIVDEIDVQCSLSIQG